MRAKFIVCSCLTAPAASGASQEKNVATRPPVRSHIPRESLASNGIASIGYSKRRHVLEIEFVNGAVYRELMAADSKARHDDPNIKSNYPSARVRPPITQQTR